MDSSKLRAKGEIWMKMLIKSLELRITACVPNTRINDNLSHLNISLNV